MQTEDIKQAVVDHIRAIALANALDYFKVEQDRVLVRDTDRLPRELGLAIASVERTGGGLKLKLYDKLKALELLGKLYALFDGSLPTGKENNLLQAILDSTQEVMPTHDLPEIQQASAAGHDLVESAGPAAP